MTSRIQIILLLAAAHAAFAQAPEIQFFDEIQKINAQWDQRALDFLTKKDPERGAFQAKLNEFMAVHRALDRIAFLYDLEHNPSGIRTNVASAWRPLRDSELEATNAEYRELLAKATAMKADLKTQKEAWAALSELRLEHCDGLKELEDDALSEEAAVDEKWTRFKMTEDSQPAH